MISFEVLGLYMCHVCSVFRYSRPVVEKKDRAKLESHLSHVASLQTEE